MRSVQGYSGGQQIGPRLQNHVLILHGWSDYIYHLGSSFDYRSTCEAGLIAGGIGDSSRCEPNESRKHPCISRHLHLRHVQKAQHGGALNGKIKSGGANGKNGAVYWLDLRLAKNKGLEFWQTNNAIILYDSMPSDCIIEIWTIQKPKFE